MRGFCSFIAIAALLTFAVVPVHAQAPVETFVQQSIDRGVAILKNTSLDAAARQKQVGELLGQVLDTRKMAIFMLGAAREKTSSADLDLYVDAYKAFTLATYESQLDGYGGQTLKVTGSIERAPGDYIVNVALLDPATPNDPSPVPISFRVADEGSGKFAVVDAGIAGIWLGLAQQADFSGYLSQHGNSVQALGTHLQEATAKLSGPAGAH
ncbi:MAG TPA: ABC transporter substrate-binding protein [Rhizomicrobium sp.]|nr:ABC transporter substrate-binding protein [Rhizomicrobium sp.]